MPCVVTTRCIAGSTALDAMQHPRCLCWLQQPTHRPVGEVAVLALIGHVVATKITNFPLGHIHLHEQRGRHVKPAWPVGRSPPTTAPQEPWAWPSVPLSPIQRLVPGVATQPSMGRQPLTLTTWPARLAARLAPSAGQAHVLGGGSTPSTACKQGKGGTQGALHCPARLKEMNCVQMGPREWACAPHQSTMRARLGPPDAAGRPACLHERHGVGGRGGVLLLSAGQVIVQ